MQRLPAPLAISLPGQVLLEYWPAMQLPMHKKHYAHASVAVRQVQPLVLSHFHCPQFSRSAITYVTLV